jgi:hypothetical protein
METNGQWVGTPNSEVLEADVPEVLEADVPEVLEADVPEVQEADALRSKNRWTVLPVWVYALVLFSGAVGGGHLALTLALWYGPDIVEAVGVGAVVGGLDSIAGVVPSFGLDIVGVVILGAVLGALGSVAGAYLTERIARRY